MPLEALLISENLTDSDSDGIGGGTGCNFIFFIYVFISPCSLPLPDRIRLRGLTWPKVSKFTVDGHLGYRNFEQIN